MIHRAAAVARASAPVAAALADVRGKGLPRYVNIGLTQFAAHKRPPRGIARVS